MAWCKDTARDAAVRAAEDGRTEPLPTLGEAIVRAFGFDKASAQRACDEVKSWPEDVQKDCRFALGILLEQGVERLQALVEAWRYGKGLLAARYPDMIPKNVSASSAVDHENKGNGMSGSTWFPASERPAPAPPATNGLQTERVTLEITHKSPTSAAEFLPRRLWWDRNGESVRVVEDAHFDDLAQVAMERDAAIRERDTLRAERITQALTADRFAAAVMEADTLRARVAELEADVNDCNIILGNRWRDAVSVVTGKAAPAASGGGEQSNQPLADGGRPRGERAESATADSSPSLSLDTPGAPADGADPTASGGGEGEPVAISPAERDGLQVIVDGVVRHGNGFVVVPGSDSLRAVESVLARHTTAPPQPRGWLTQEERALVQSWERHYTQGAHYAQSPSHTNDIAAEMGKLAEVCRAFLARSSPPEVVLDAFPTDETGEFFSRRDVIKALAAAGVAVKETI